MSFRYIDFDVVVAINAEHCGDGAGVRDEGGIRAALGRAEASFMGEDLHATVIEKAAVLMHGLSSTQYFHDGNKRTAWLVAKLFLALNGHLLRAVPDVQAEAFVLAIATKAFENDEHPTRSIEKAAEWYATQRLTMSDRRDFAFLSLAATWAGEKGDAAFNAIGGAVAGALVTSFPMADFYTVVLRIRWVPEDATLRYPVRIFIEPGTGAANLYTPTPHLRRRLEEADDSTELTLMPEDVYPEYLGTWSAVAPSDHPHHGPGSIMPTIVLQEVILEFKSEGLVWVRVEIGGELFARLPMSIQQHRSFTGPITIPEDT